MTSSPSPSIFFFFFNAPPTTEIYTLSLHDALPICTTLPPPRPSSSTPIRTKPPATCARSGRSEEHTSELQSQFHLVCRLLLEKKKNFFFLFSQPKTIKKTSQ